MNSADDKQAFRSIPSVDELLAAPEIAALRERHPRLPWTHLARGATGDARAGKLGPLGAGRDDIRLRIVTAIVSRVKELETGGMRRVINGTGVVLNTNLGRAILPEAAIEAAREAMAHYVSLEIDLATGKRGRRGEVLEELVVLATQAERAMIVNNNAAAVWLAVSSFSPPGRVIVSRGELVEIGGSFRLPDILEMAASEVVEVGTTNRTYASDYEKEARAGDLLLKAHRSNYEIQGFTHEPDVGELVRVAAEKKCHVVFDLGSGCLFDFASRGLEGETQVQEAVRMGVDCVTMSGDKLLGGPQAGIIVGREGFVAKLRQNPLRRALRVDKTTIAALQALMRAYLFSASPETVIPILRQATGSVDELRTRAAAIIEALDPGSKAGFDVRAEDDLAAIGGGSFACQDLPSVAVAIRCASEGEAVALSRAMREGRIPILARIKGNEVRVNLRSVPPYEDDDVARGLNAVLGNP